MLYQENKKDSLDLEVFRNPGAEYRGAPFWSWNCVLQKEELLRQIEVLKEMGFGGFHMHSRAGMATPYLSEEFMSLIKACTEKAKDENMLAWLYDEDRWPSGFAGGFVTKNPEHRQKLAVFTKSKKEAVSKEKGIREGKPYLLACYDIKLSESGSLREYKQIGEADSADNKWYVYVTTAQTAGRFNGYCYADTMSKEAIGEFIKITHDTYAREVGEHFGKTVPAIFTDEPHMYIRQMPQLSTDEADFSIAWTTDLPETYLASYGEDILATLPELRWEREDNIPSRARYLYVDHVCERFASAFSDQIGEWCDKNGILMTGHLVEEPNLHSQAPALGEAMRCYRGFTLPGIDILSNRSELTTAKQAESAAHQYGRCGVLSELYGVTGWHFDFRSHKFQGDWQAALGVTVRVPHLSWVSMKGSAKRDYPASINYQSPWYKEYSAIEDHFARVASVLTRGKPVVKLGVIHPIESYWLHIGPKDKTADICEEMEADFLSLTDKLLYGNIDFDFISESLIPKLYAESCDSKLHMGKMKYDAIVVPKLETIRKSTLKVLADFEKRGGKLIFIGGCPTLTDAILSDEARELYDKAIHISHAGLSLLSALEEQRDIRIIPRDSKYASCFFYQLREEGESRYLFIAHGKQEKNIDTNEPPFYGRDNRPEEITVEIKGTYRPKLLDTSSGDIRNIPYENKNGMTIIDIHIGMSDSLLFSLTPGTPSQLKSEAADRAELSVLDIKKPVSFYREEPNVMLLDLAEWSLDGVLFNPTEEILRIDRALRKKYSYPEANGRDFQPWAIPQEKIEHYPFLRFKWESGISAPCSLAFEEAEKIIFNGNEISTVPNGCYVDKSIHTVFLGNMKKGENELIVSAPFSKRISLENLYLLGDFDVSLCGCEKRIEAPRSKIAFGDITTQGMPYYGGNLVYQTDWDTPEGEAELCVSHYRGALMRIYIDGTDIGRLIYAPYKKKFKLSRGKHRIEIKLYGNRNNTFGPLHNADPGETWFGPNTWYNTGSCYSYEYSLSPMGVLISPVLKILK